MRSRRMRALGAADRAAAAFRERAGPLPMCRRSREELRAWRLRHAARSLQADQEEVRRGRPVDLRLQLLPQRQLHRRRRSIAASRWPKRSAPRSSPLRRRSTVARRVAPFAEKHQMVVAMHGHSNTTAPGEFATPESFAEAMKMSKYFKVNLDIGHFTAAELRRRRSTSASTTPPSRTCTSRIGRRTRATTCRGAAGTRRSARCCSCSSANGGRSARYIEYEHRGEGTPVEEVKKCYAFVKQALA